MLPMPKELEDKVKMLENLRKDTEEMKGMKEDMKRPALNCLFKTPQNDQDAHRTQVIEAKEQNYNRMSSTTSFSNPFFIPAAATCSSSDDIPEEFRQPPSNSFGEGLLQGGVKRRLSLAEADLKPCPDVIDLADS